MLIIRLVIFFVGILVVESVFYFGKTENNTPVARLFIYFEFFTYGYAIGVIGSDTLFPIPILVLFCAVLRSVIPWLNR